MMKVVPSPDAALELECAAVFLDDDGAGDGEPLAGSAADLLRREERIEDPLADRGRDAGSRVAEADFDPVAVDAACAR